MAQTAASRSGASRGVASTIGGVKIFAIVAGIVVGLIALAVGAGFIWFQQNKEQLRAQALVAREEGTTFGASSWCPIPASARPSGSIC